MRYLLSASLSALIISCALPAAAQPSGASMPGMSGMGSMTPMQHDMMIAMQHMNENMMAATDSEPDRAFAKKMIAHHEGAIAMSEIEVRMGKDAQAKRLAQQTITENRSSIGKLNNFLAHH